MDREEFNATVSLAGTVGLLTALLPSVDKLFDADNTDPQLRKHVVGANTVFGAIALILIIQAYSAGYKQAAAIGALVLGTATFYFNYAFLTAPLPHEAKIRTIEAQ